MPISKMTRLCCFDTGLSGQAVKLPTKNTGLQVTSAQRLILDLDRSILSPLSGNNETSLAKEVY